MIKYFLQLVFIGIFPFILEAQPETGMPTEPGKCFAKCKIPELFEIRTEKVPLYIGNNFKDPNITVFKFLKDSEKETVGLAVKDTNLTKEFVMTEVSVNKLIKSETIEWREVICNKDIDGGFLQKLAGILNKEEFYSGEVEVKKFNRDLRIALKQYQKYYNLPIGQIDIETLTHLGIFF